MGKARLAGALDVSARTLARMESAALIPRPVRIGRTKKWRCEEIAEWVRAGCPPRARWEALNRERGR
jgi:predicted DNA-binding transcriptional regulator AlpA